MVAIWQMKAASGKRISSTVPYGYMKSPEDKEKWIIDEEEYDKFSLTELEIVLEKVYNMILDLKNELLTTTNPELQKYLKIEINKYEYMLNEINKLYVSKKYVKRF